jgi:excisionase family DNA binding protein
MSALRGSIAYFDWDALPSIATVAEAAAFLRVPKAAIYAAIHLGILPAINLGIRRTRIAKEALRKVFGVPVEGGRMTAAFGHASEV